MNMNRKIGIVVLGVLICLITGGLITGGLITGEAWAGEDAALVNGQPVTLAEYDREVSLFRERLEKQGVQLPPQYEAKLKENVLNEMINRELLYQESQKQGIKVSETQAKEQLIAIRGTYPDPQKFSEMLKRVQLTEAELMIHIRQRLAVKTLVDKKIESQVTVSDAEVKAYYEKYPDRFQQPEQVHASHILIKADETTNAEQIAAAKKTLTELKIRAEKGEDFATLAKAHSQGPSGPRGGDLGTFGRGQMVKPFEETAFALAPEQISDVVETQFGFHLIKVHSKIPARTFGFEEIKPRLAQQLRSTKINQVMGPFVETLRQAAKIETFVN